LIGAEKFVGGERRIVLGDGKYATAVEDYPGV
jgi:hypothetical protein